MAPEVCLYRTPCEIRTLPSFKPVLKTLCFHRVPSPSSQVVRGGTTEEGSATGYGRKCDVWSIGCVIIQMASAKPPWAGTYDVKNKFQLIFKVSCITPYLTVLLYYPDLMSL